MQSDSSLSLTTGQCAANDSSAGAVTVSPQRSRFCLVTKTPGCKTIGGFVQIDPLFHPIKHFFRIPHDVFLCATKPHTTQFHKLAAGAKDALRPYVLSLLSSVCPAGCAETLTDRFLSDEYIARHEGWMHIKNDAGFNKPMVRFKVILAMLGAAAHVNPVLAAERHVAVMRGRLPEIMCGGPLYLVDTDRVRVASVIEEGDPREIGEGAENKLRTVFVKPDGSLLTLSMPGEIEGEHEEDEVRETEEGPLYHVGMIQCSLSEPCCTAQSSAIRRKLGQKPLPSEVGTALKAMNLRRADKDLVVLAIDKKTGRTSSGARFLTQ